MGYTTDFAGSVTLVPPLNEHEVTYLQKFASSRRMDRERGPYFIGSGMCGQGRDDDIRDYNRPPAGQPGLWCKWEPSEDGTTIGWNGAEKFYDSEDWMRYLIDTFLRSGAALQQELRNSVPGRAYPEEFSHFTFDHVVNGEIVAQGELEEDSWILIVTDCEVSTLRPEQ